MTRPATIHEDGTPVRRKSTLFCWGCDHESPIGGDWERRTKDRHVDVVCPVCETTITKRPRSEEQSRERVTAQTTATWRQVVRATVYVWRASVGVGLSGVAAMALLRLPERTRR